MSIPGDLQDEGGACGHVGPCRKWGAGENLWGLAGFGNWEPSTVAWGRGGRPVGERLSDFQGT